MAEKTLSIVKPHIAVDFPGQMLKIAREAIQEYRKAGLKIIRVRRKHFSQEEAEMFYEEHRGKPFFPLLVEASIMGPSIVIDIEGEEAIAKVRAIHGPTNPPDCQPEHLRKKYGRDERGRPFNGFHGTATPEEYSRERRIALE